MLQDELTSLHRQLVQPSIDAIEWRMAHDLLKLDLERTQQEIHPLDRTELMKYEESIGYLQNQKKKFETRVRELTHSFSETQVEIDGILNEVDQLEWDRAKLQNMLKEREKMLDVMKEEFTSCSTKGGEMEEELIQTRETLERSHNELLRLRNELNDMKKSHEDRQKIYNDKVEEWRRTIERYSLQLQESSRKVQQYHEEGTYQANVITILQNHVKTLIIDKEHFTHAYACKSHSLDKESKNLYTEYEIKSLITPPNSNSKLHQNLLIQATSYREVSDKVKKQELINYDTIVRDLQIENKLLQEKLSVSSQLETKQRNRELLFRQEFCYKEDELKSVIRAQNCESEWYQDLIVKAISDFEVVENIRKEVTIGVNTMMCDSRKKSNKCPNLEKKNSGILQSESLVELTVMKNSTSSDIASMGEISFDDSMFLPNTDDL